MKKRVLSLFMALALCLTLLPVSPAWAKEADAPEGGITTVSEQGGTNEEENGAEGGQQNTGTPDAGGAEDSKADAPKSGEDENAGNNADAAVSAVQTMIDALPIVSELDGMTADELDAAYDDIQAAYDAYEALNAEQQAQITGADCFKALFGWFNSQTALLADAQSREHTHCVCGKTHQKIGDHGQADEKTFKPWDKTDSLPTSGAYYLTQDVTISGNVTLNENVNLCLNGQTINGKITIGSGATLTLTDCSGTGKLQGNGSGSGVSINGGTFNLYEGTITGFVNGVEIGSHNDIKTGSSFTMYGGAITDNKAGSASGGGVFLIGTTNSNVTAPSFTMHGGTISNNTAGASDGGGGGIYVGENCSFTMDGGTITGNTATNGNGGGIYIHFNAGIVSISNATITGNKASATGNTSYGHGGGIYSQRGVTVKNVTITGNNSTYEGGGIYGKGAIALTDATVTDNNHYDVYYDGAEKTTPELTVSGSVKAGYYANFDWKLPILVSGALSKDSVIRVGVREGIKPNAGGSLLIAEPASGVTLNAKNFEADAADCVTNLGDDGKVYLVPCTHEMDDTGYTCSKCHTQFDARVGDSAYYQTLTKAFDAARGSTVTLLRNVTLTENCSAAYNSPATLDLNGKTVSSGDYRIGVGGGNKPNTLTVKDSGTGGGTQALDVTFYVSSNGTLAVDDSYTGKISRVELQAGGALERFGGKIGELALSNAAYGSTSTGYGLKLWKGNTNACTIGRFTDNTKSKSLTVSDLLGTDYAKCELYGEKGGAWSIVDKSAKIVDLKGYTAYKVQFPECVHQCDDDTVAEPVCSVCHKNLYTKITAKAADGTTKTAYFTADSALEHGYVEAIQTLNGWSNGGCTEPTLTLLRNMDVYNTSMPLTGTLTLKGGTHTAKNVTVAENANVTFASGSYIGATIDGTATVEGGVTFTSTVTVNGTLNAKGGTFDDPVKFNGSSIANISGGNFNSEKKYGGVTFDYNVTGTISGGTFAFADFYTTKVKLSGGTFTTIKTNGDRKLADLLAEGAAYYNGDSAVSDDNVSSLANVTVKSHKHNGGTDGKGICSICNKQMAASLTVGGKTSWYTAFATAIEAANAADGEKAITLYQDVDDSVYGKRTTYELTRGPVTLATGGKRVDGVDLIAKGISLTVTGSNGSFYVTVDGKDAKLTVNDKDTKLAIVTAKNGGKLSLSNGTFSRVAVKDDGSSASLSGGSYGAITSDAGYVKPYALLAKGYAYKKTKDNQWLPNANSIPSEVTVEKAPFAVEKIYPNSDEGYTGNSAFATDGNITLTAVIAPEIEGVTYYYWWELFNESTKDWTTHFGDVNTATHTGEQSKTLTISGLPVDKSYQYHIFVQCSNGYNCYSEPFTVTRHQHSWTYTASGATITAKCSKCDASGGSVTIAAPAELIYSGEGKPATVTASSDWQGPAASGITISYIKSGKYIQQLENGALPTNAGTYTASITLGGKEVSVQYTINKADLTVTANPATITYGDTAVSNGVTYSGFVNGEDESVLGGELTYTFSYTPGMDVGNFIITPAGKTSGNYDITFAHGTLTVEQRTVTLTWHNYENRTYGDGKYVYATAGNLLEADVGKVQVMVRGNGANATGTFTATAFALSGYRAHNYKLPTTGRTQEYTIGRAEQTLTFAKTGDQSLTYGETLANPATNNRADGSEVTYSSSDPAVATVDANGKVTAKNVGTTTITATAKAVDGKYSEATVSYELEVTARPIFLTITPVTYYYGQPGVSFTPSLCTVSGSLAEGDDYKTLKLSWSSVGTMWKAGTFDVNATSYNSNYNVTFDGTGKLIVLPRPITVTVDAASRVYGDADPAFTAQQTGGMGFVNGETVASLGLSLSSTATATSPVGKYDVTGTASNTNYNVTVLGEKKLTVTAKPITVTVDAVSRAYGDENPAFTATAPSNTLVGEDTIESLGLSLTTAADTTSPVGSYNVTGSASNTNYTVTVDGMNKLTVNPKELKANDLELTGSFVKTYDGNVNATAVGAHVKSGVLVGNDTLNITGSAVYNSEDVKDANSITFTPNAITEGNYRLAAAEKVTVTEGVKINRRTITIASVQATSKQYDGDTTAYSCITSVTFNGLVEGETLTKSGLQNGTYVTGDYGINSANFNSANVNEANKITGEVGITNPNLNYTFKESGKETSTAPFTTTGSITPANSWSLTPVTDLTIRYNNRDLRTYTPNWSTLLPSGQTWTYSASTATTGSAALSTNTIGADTGVLSYQLSAGNVSDTATWTVTASCANYQSFTLAVTLTLIARDEQTGFKFENNTTSVTKTYGDEDFTIAASGGATGSSVTYTSSDETVAKVDEDGKVTIVGAGITTIKAKASETADFEEKEISYTLTVKPKTLAKDDLTYSGSITKVYDGSTNAPSGLTVSVDPSSLVNGDTLTVNGTLKFNSANVGEASEITFIPTAITTGNYTLAATEALTIRSASITAKEVTLTSGINATNRSYAKDNKTVALTKGTLAFTGLVSGETLDVNIPDTGTIFDTKVGTYNVTYSGVTLKDGTTGKASNYKLVGSLPTVTVTISKAAAPVLADIPVSFKYTVTTGEKAIGNAGIPADAGTLTYSKGTATKTGTVTVTSWDVDSTTGKVTYTLSGGKAGDSATLFVTIASTNYEDATVNVVITLTARDNQVELRITGGTTVVYGQTLALNTSGGSGSGAVTYTVVNGTGEATIDPNTGVLTPVKVGSVSVIATKAGDNDYNAVTSAPVEITITKATPTGEPKYTEIKTGGKTLADAALTIEGSTLKPNAGTLEWVDDKGNVLSNDTKVEANTTYKWRFTPTDGNYTVLTGSIELYHKSSSGGSGWYYTYYTIKATAGTNGSISPSGWTSVRDGRDQTFTITPDKGYAVAKVLVDGKSVGAVKSYTFKNVTKDHTIEAIFMKSNGNPQTGVFVDVAEGSYYEEAIDWAVEKGITNGVSSNMFAPNDPCTRAQIVTFLWRAAGSPAPKSMSSFTDVPADAFYAKAVAWAVENGITSGTGEGKFSPNSTCTRAQAVTFLYRASGSPAVSGKAEFSDVSSTAFYADAVAWAAKKGITTGIGGGLFGSDNDCTRGQIVTFLWRAMAE